MHVRQQERKAFIRRGAYELDDESYWCEHVDLVSVTTTTMLIEYLANRIWTRYDSEDVEVLMELAQRL